MNIVGTTNQGYTLKVSSITGNDYQVRFNCIDDDLASLEVKTFRNGVMIGNTDLRVMPLNQVSEWMKKILIDGLKDGEELI